MQASVVLLTAGGLDANQTDVVWISLSVLHQRPDLCADQAESPAVCVCVCVCVCQQHLHLSWPLMSQPPYRAYAPTALRKLDDGLSGKTFNMADTVTNEYQRTLKGF